MRMLTRVSLIPADVGFKEWIDAASGVRALLGAHTPSAHALAVTEHNAVSGVRHSDSRANQAIFQVPVVKLRQNAQQIAGVDAIAAS